ncbi:crossover junction endodeoxyribonuclease RuvC [Candidatus Dojkabacteria bacterium]|uniref:Crossover junction endodeoxyribonuclease RuvC n=1 Tax=Candidatus Dojkabacteria bacterium TaxID=2099670 RepID=A0A955RIB5_9BACT|nr:crossover junction endodeoxyribonuclease RuvC [Candidatus Dojkabacteria bacterium]
MLTILGIDTGYALTGYGIVTMNDRDISVVDFGVIKTESSSFPTDRFNDIYEGITELIDKYSPDVMAIEQIFFFKNQKTFVNVLQARGVILISAIHKNIQIAEYTPLQVKQALTGYGRADKSQIQTMVKARLNLSEIPKPDDAADALAICLTHIQTSEF